eukprot:CAMPEP_0196140944 /NCGR_PEP_ID=MMETSP0910-20130528/8080_1 /TAXON_ID=49265 /ORGANISM="Thalassiosira rotula, Strain GSO102" /LENGTH=72 /DNA_ID=CAMNT_0041401905 /DNA_START=166 /DNA_END=384 /DNA_ORIENTATION=-
MKGMSFLPMQPPSPEPPPKDSSSALTSTPVPLPRSALASRESAATKDTDTVAARNDVSFMSFIVCDDKSEEG